MSVLLLLAQVGQEAAKAQDDGPVKFEINPSAVALTPTEGATVLAVVRNTSQRPLHSLSLTAFEAVDLGFKATPDTVTLVVLSPKASHAWSVEIERESEGRTGGSLYFQLDYSWRPESSRGMVRGVAIAALEISENVSSPIEQIADVRIETSVSELQEHRPGGLFLVVTNKSGDSLVVKQVEARVINTLENRPSTIEITPVGNVTRVSIGPRTSRAFGFRSTVGDVAQLGSQLIIFQTTMEWRDKGRRVSGSLVTSHTFDVSILGESALLKILGVPVFLFLPGFLMALVFMILWKSVHPKSGQYDVMKPGFWVSAISLSILAGMFYPGVTDFFGNERNYLYGYGLVDILYVWGGSLVAGLMAWILCVSAILGVATIKSWYRRQLTEYSVNDKPLRMLRKMNRNDVVFPLDRASVKIEGGTETLFVVVKVEQDYWLMPKILWTVNTKGADANLRHEIISKATDCASDLESAVQLVESLHKNVSFEWKESRAVAGPVRRNESDVTVPRSQTPETLFEEGH